MQQWLIAPVVGGCLLLAGLALMRSHARTWRDQKQDATLDELDRRHYHARYRRRMQTSALIAVLGVLLAAGDAFIPANAPRLFAVYWIGVLVLASWVVLLGLGDMASTGAHSRVALARIHQKQRELEEQMARIKTRNSNGHHPN